MYTTIYKSYNCHNCGTELNGIGNIFRCPYCGATYEETYVTPGGETVIAFGVYGYDG